MNSLVQFWDEQKELGLTHLLMMDDDAVFDPDIFVRLFGFLSTLLLYLVPPPCINTISAYGWRKIIKKLLNTVAKY